jgi:hypothetical protein
MIAPRVSVIIPHFQTAVLARLCLRAIRRHTHDVPIEVIVVDNGSKDGESMEYLRSVEWIHLIERTEGIADSPGESHKEALDIGVAASRAPFILSFHTDTIALRSDWLSWHLAQLEASPRIAAVGTYKLEVKSGIRQVLKDLERIWTQRISALSHVGDHRPYIRSHCALYRRDVLESLGLHFVDHSKESAGRTIHFALEDAGYEAKQLSTLETSRRVAHLNHGTMVLVPELGVCRRTARSGNKRIQDFLLRPEIQSLLREDSLDKVTQPRRRSA